MTKVATEEQARRELRSRQGAGARYDSSEAPAGDLLLARRGTAYFARKLGELSNAELDGPSRMPGWSRRHVVAHVSYQARHLARLVEAARTGRGAETLVEPYSQNEDVAFAATLPADALRHLFHHSEVHLNVEWRDLSAAGWRLSVVALDGDTVAIRDTPLMRARHIWKSAVDLRNGGSDHDLPAGLASFPSG